MFRYYNGDPNDFGWGHMIVGGIAMLLFWTLFIVLVVWLVRSLSHDHGHHHPHPLPPMPPHVGPGSGARELLDLRYAKGEITEDEYKRMRAVLEGTDAR